MSWIYSIVFASLLFSTDGETAATQPVIEAPVVTVAAKKDETEKFEQSYPISAKGRVSVANVNGSIVVEAWDRNEVRLEATKIADSKESLADVEIKVESTADSFSVEADYREWKWNDKSDKQRNRKIEVEFKLSVPRTAMLNEVETVNGSVTVSNFVNYTKISAVNGHVNAGNLRGTASLSTVNGQVTADFDQLETGSKISLSTVNGRVNLTIPSDANATIKADSLNGNITNDFGLPVRKGEYVGRDLHGKVGNGDVQIKLNSVNGPLAIGKKNDGRSPNPATNLLPAKGKSDKSDKWDKDDDEDTETSVNTAHVTREVARAMRDAERATADASREAAKAMDSINLVELEKMKVKIDGKKIEKDIKEGLKVRTEALSRMQDAMWLGGSNTVVERKTNTFAVKGTPKVNIDAKNCDVKVRGWDKPEVKYVFTEFPESFRRSSPTTVKEEQTSSGVNITVGNGSSKAGDDLFQGGSERRRLEVFVPRKSNLKITADGEIRLEGVSGELEVFGNDGAIDVRGSDGKLKVTNTDGPVRVIGFNGDLTAETVDGEVYLDGEFNKIDGKAVDGKFVLTLPEGADADIRAPGERVAIEDLPNGTKVSENNWRFGKGGRKYNFSSVDGSLEVRNRDLISAER